MVPSDIVDEIRHRTNLIDLVSEVTRLKRSGTNWMGCCPFHEEKTPSFSVSEEKQLYHCFGCGESGTVFSFMMNYHRLSFPEALDRLAHKAGIDLAPYKQGQSAQEYKQSKLLKKKMGELLAYANDCFQKCLKKSSRADLARPYVLARGYDMDLVKRWGVGFAPAGAQHLYQAMLKKGFEEKLMVESGLVGKNQNGIYDMYRNRIVFPISDFEGHTVGFGARVLDDSKPKYINSPEHALFNKRKILYGLFQAKDAIKKTGKALVVEGYTDVISLHRYGFENTVGSLGTAFTKDHAKLIRKYTHQVVFVFDGDSAGAGAAYKSIIPSVSEGIDARVIFLDQGMDPDTVMHDENSREVFRKQLINPSKLLDYFIEKEFVKRKEIHQKSAAIELLVDLVKQTSDVYMREALVDELAQQTGIEKDIFYGKTAYKVAALSPIQNKKNSRPVEAVKNLQHWREESLLLRILLEVPQSLDRYIQEGVELFFDQDFQTHILPWLDANRETGKEPYDVAKSIDLWPVDEHKSALSKAFLQDTYNIAQDWEKIWLDCTKTIKNRRIKVLTKQLQDHENASSEDINTIFNEIEGLKKTLQTYSKPERS